MTHDTRIALFLMGELVAALRANDTDLFKRIALLIPPEERGGVAGPSDITLMLTAPYRPKDVTSDWESTRKKSHQDKHHRGF